MSRLVYRVFFFFQAEDGIRDYKVTGVQTCALPISNGSHSEPTSRRLHSNSNLAMKNLRQFWTNPGAGDRKSTRLNSSHLVISYAVFCLKKKKKNTTELSSKLNMV